MVPLAMLFTNASCNGKKQKTGVAYGSENNKILANYDAVNKGGFNTKRNGKMLFPARVDTIGRMTYKFKIGIKP